MAPDATDLHPAEQANELPTLTLGVEEALRALAPHFISLALEVSENMELVLTLGCPLEWVCFGSARVTVLPVKYLTGAVLVRFSRVTSEVPADELLAHASLFIEKNRQIEAQREAIAKQQRAAQEALEAEIRDLMVATGGQVLAQSAELARPVVEPPTTYSMPAQHYQPDLHVHYGPDGEPLAPTIEQLRQGI